MNKNFLKVLWTVALLVLPFAPPAKAEDIDLFTVSRTPGRTPTVLFVLDNTANWEQPFNAEKAALAAAFRSLKESGYRVGLMMFSETGNGNSNADGAYVRAAIRLLDSNTKEKYANLIEGLDKSADKSNGGKLGKTMVEIHRYLTSGVPMGGNNKLKADYSGNVSGNNSASKTVWALPGNALSAFDSNRYVGPSTADCNETYVIYISNGAVQDNSNDSKTAADALRAAGGNTTPLVLSPSGSQDNMADEWAAFLKSSLGVTVYTIEAAKAASGQGPGWTKLLRSMAEQTTGQYYDVTPGGTGNPDLAGTLGEALEEIFSKIQAVNSVFSSVSLPVSVNTQGTYLNQVFVGMFRPDEQAYPRWNGNLKQYKLGLDDNKQLILQDARNKNAINELTGFIAPCALSFWTAMFDPTTPPENRDTYWSFRTPKVGTCLGWEASDTPDGDVVEKGAQAYKLRNITVAARNVKTCDPAGCTALIDFNTANVRASDLGLSNNTDRDTLVSWARGEDNKGDERLDSDGKPLTSANMRPSVHGDVVHSRPVAINYGSSDTPPKVVVFYGGNDGALRAVNGNQTDMIGSAAPGSELWSFFPPEFYGSLKRLRDNDIRINFPEMPASAGTTAPKPYGMDGPISAYRKDNTAWVFASMRRGGRMIYAFDVSEPAAPTFKWRKGCPNQNNDDGCSTGLAGIGQTWSAPKVVKVSGYSAPLLVFGGGYDKCEDVDTNKSAEACGPGMKGNKIYVLDADTGAVLKTFDTQRPVTGEVTIVSDGAGLAKLAYAADLGGNVYRISINDSPPNAWNKVTLASLGCEDATACTPNRKFMFGPDVVEDNNAYVVLLGSGDREKPIRYYANALNVVNRFYMLVDKPSDETWLTAEATRCGAVEVLCHQSLFGITTTASPTGEELAAKKGWYLALAAGEQVVTGSVTAYGTTTFNTHIPTDPAARQTCGPDLGKARVYNVSYLNAAPATGTSRFDIVHGGGLAPTPVVGRVQVDGQMRDVVIGANPDSFLSPRGAAVKAAFRQPKGRVYWFIQK
jgi:type IV pilus assembly protein PilY1